MVAEVIKYLKKLHQFYMNTRYLFKVDGVIAIGRWSRSEIAELINFLNILFCVLLRVKKIFLLF